MIVVASALAAGSVGDFYRGKQMTIVVGSEAGGGYDVAARLMSHYLGKYIPGDPTIIIQNMPGAGGVLAINDVANLAPEDGTMIGAPQSGSALEPVLHLLSAGGSNAKFDGTKLQWIGSVEDAIYLFAFWHDSPIHTFDDLKRQTVLVGATSSVTDESIFSNLVNNIFGTKMKIIRGYGSSPEIALAMERGEIAGALNTYSSLMFKQPNWLKEDKVRVVVQLSDSPFTPLKDVPMALDLVKNDDDRRILEVVLAKSKMARPYFMANGVPTERVAAIRRAFLSMLADPRYLEDATRAGLLVSPVSGEEVQKIIGRVYQTPKPLLERVRQAIGGQQ
jgi:tripartite-type tricarboxylate transporter receptor subunit TctC